MSATHVLLAGPTASGKSALALCLAERLDAVIVNADALQVYDCWRVLSARPSQEDEICAPHRLFGHVDYTTRWSMGHWMRDVAQVLAELDAAGQRAIITGGTGLYFSALTQGIAEIPQTPDAVRDRGNDIRAGSGAAGFREILAARDPESLETIDQDNVMRLQRAWEVLEATGRSIRDWQRETGPPLLPITRTLPLVMHAEPTWLDTRIAGRFDAMLDSGAIAEVEAVMARGWDPTLPAARALGASQIRDHLLGRIAHSQAREDTRIATRRFAKRQRTWFRNRMQDWRIIAAEVTTRQSADNILNTLTSLPNWTD